MITEDYNFIDVDFYIEYRMTGAVSVSVPGTAGDFEEYCPGTHPKCDQQLFGG